MEIKTKCDRCRKTLRIENFISERDKAYSRCHRCHMKSNVLFKKITEEDFSPEDFI